MTSMEREEKEKVKKREKKLEDEETMQQATWVKYTFPIKHQVLHTVTDTCTRTHSLRHPHTQLRAAPHTHAQTHTPFSFGPFYRASSGPFKSKLYHSIYDRAIHHHLIAKTCLIATSCLPEWRTVLKAL